MLRYEVRGATLADEEQLLSLAGFLNTVNLPNDRPHIRRLLEHSEGSFRGEIPRNHRKFVFLLRDRQERAAVGTSMIVAQLGRRDAPYIYLDVISEEKYSHAVDKHFHHTVLKIGFSYAGPTEIGGLVVHPEHRRGSDRLGLLISYVRFLYLTMHRDWFQEEVLAELLPPLEPDGTSHLWEALGRHFTGMSYAEADLLSSTDKTFIRDLFPSGDIYASLLSRDAQEVIGKVGAQTRGVEKMLRRIGFRYAERIDPFDGGPHFVADMNEISLVSDTRECTITSLSEGGGEAGVRALVGLDLESAPYFRALPCRVELSDNRQVRLSAEAATDLGVALGARVFVLPLR